MKRTLRLNETDLTRIIRRVISEQSTQPVPLFEECPDKMNSLVRLVGKSNVPSSCLKAANSSNDISSLEQECVDSLQPLWEETYRNLDYSRMKSRSYKKDTEIINAIAELTQCYFSSENVRMNDYDW